jgi:predicted RNA-binding protein with PIN domain
MATPGYIVDGYNLLHCFRDLGRLANRDLENARDRLVSRLGAFRGRKRIRMWVVFDGKGRPGHIEQGQRFGVRVVFSGPVSADRRIIQLLQQEKNPRAWTVVSSDRWVKDHARAAGANVTGSGAFADSIRSVPGTAGKEPEKPEMKPGDVAEWEEYFRRPTSDG